uniref:Mitochondrial transcription termination factor 2 n=1 Tax=Leptobrachium leishanense TaxID=445787 RepID=A0A8C5M6E2_9ANUR
MYKANMLTRVIRQLLESQKGLAFRPLVPPSYCLIFGPREQSKSCLGTDANNNSKENKRTVEQLYYLSVNIKKIRQVKGWVLSKDAAYVEETADFLKSLGAGEMTVASILERCPEAFLHDPVELDAKKCLWRSVCSSDDQLLKIIEKFPESFFSYKYPENQRANINYFQDLGLNKKIVCRLLTSSPQIFCNSVEDNEHIISTLEENYLGLGGSEANFKTWLMKLLSQDPFIILKPPSALKKNLHFIQRLGFCDHDVLKLLSNLKGFIFDLNCNTMESSMLFTKKVFECSDEELKPIILKFPGVLYYTVPVLEERLKCLLKEGASLDQVKACPSVLELTTQIVEYRIAKIKSLGHKIKDQNLEVLNGTKKDFEVSYGRLQVKKMRPLFNPVAPLQIDE